MVNVEGSTNEVLTSAQNAQNIQSNVILLYGHQDQTSGGILLYDGMNLYMTNAQTNTGSFTVRSVVIDGDMHNTFFNSATYKQAVITFFNDMDGSCRNHNLPR
jgi:hypothetical protein